VNTVVSPWLTIVGLGEDGVDGLSPLARQIVADAQVLVGGTRHLAMIPEGCAARIEWTSPFATNLDRLAERQGQPVCVLASGDPMWFGVGVTLARRFGREALRVIPHPGAFSLAAARMGWALQETRCLSIHGRAFEALALHLAPRAQLLLLAEDGRSVAEVAAWLTEEGLGDAQLDLFEHLGGPAERHLRATAANWPLARSEDLNTIAVTLPDRLDAGWLPPGGIGLPDDAFRHDGQITKREIRAVTLSTLSPWPGGRLWDVGAGCGSVAIEWCRAGGEAWAIEKDESRCAMIADNALALGVPRLGLKRGVAPAALAGLPDAPDAIFLGGGLTAPGVFEACWAALRSGGRLVANAVTAESEALMLAWRQAVGGSLIRLAVTRLDAVGRFHTWHPAMPVTQFVAVKP
jgi:precorrin-6Y C5,15-methyltransferase (decarboxylating)